MIEINDVSKQYGAIHALEHINLKLDGNHIIGLLGQNGAGKTTLMNIVTGYLAPTSGSVQIDGYDPLLKPIEAKSLIGYLPQIPPLYGEMTVREYLHFVAELRMVKRKHITAHVDEIMEMTGLTEMSKRVIANLSKGYKQRTGFAQALCGDPKILILDEPTVGLDPKQVTEIRQLIRELGKERTILFSSHILSEVHELCDQIVIIDQGRVCMNTLEETAENDRVVLKCVVCTDKISAAKIVHAINGAEIIDSINPSGVQNQTELRISFVKVDLPEKQLFSQFSTKNVPILHLSRLQNTLEQTFLNVILGKEEPSH